MRVSIDREPRVAFVGCLRRSGVTLGKTETEAFLERVAESLAAFIASRRQPASRYRQVHDALRKLWLYAQRKSCDPARLLVWLKGLPPEALANIERRAAIVLPKLFPGEFAEQEFMVWAKRASAKTLVRAVRVLAADGATPVVGRKQADGKRSRSKPEPLIAGQVRGDKGKKPGGGRIPHEDQDALVRHLAIDWLLAAGSIPLFGRSDRTGFGDLVHTVFQAIGEPGATQALRRYSAALRQAKSKAGEDDG